MRKKSTYRIALDSPTKKGGHGWKYAGKNSVNAACAELLARRFAVRAEAVYDWAEKHEINLEVNMAKLYKNCKLVICGVLQDKSLAEVENNRPVDDTNCAECKKRLQRLNRKDKSKK